ncbi:MAG: SCO1664 family protein, partial [Acidimicrobiales bacterium]
MSLLAEGEIEVVGRMPWSSNQTFLVTCTMGDEETGAVYKPERGERHLWDFPEGIYRREIAAYRLSATLGWDLVPETIARADAPFGQGSLQQFVDADFSQHHFTLVEDPAHHDRLRKMCAFDVVANNADRKSGHCILGPDGTIWGIDNGLCFHREPKLRTVIWEFAGDDIAPALLEDLSGLEDALPGP